MPSNKFPPRRAFLAGSAAFISAAVLTRGTFAATTAEAESYVDRMVVEVLANINSGASEATILASFERTFSKYGDVPIIARSSLGVAWRSASASQRKAFVAAFSRYVSVKYGRQFASFKGATLTLKGSRDAGKKGILVQSQLKMLNQPAIIIEWQLSDKSGSLKIFNLIIEGISMLSAEREEIGNMLAARRGNVDALIRDLRAVN